MGVNCGWLQLSLAFFGHSKQGNPFVSSCRWKWRTNMIFRTLPVWSPSLKPMPLLSPSLMPNMMSVSRKLVPITRPTCKYLVILLRHVSLFSPWDMHLHFKLLTIIFAAQLSSLTLLSLLTAAQCSFHNEHLSRITAPDQHFQTGFQTFFFTSGCSISPTSSGIYRGERHHACADVGPACGKQELQGSERLDGSILVPLLQWSGRSISAGDMPPATVPR